MTKVVNGKNVGVRECGANSGWRKRKQNGDKPCKVSLPDGKETVMTKDEMYACAEELGMKLVYQKSSDLYLMVTPEVYSVIKRPEWSEAKRKQRNRVVLELEPREFNDLEEDDRLQKQQNQAGYLREVLVPDFHEALQARAGYEESPEEILLLEERKRALHEALDTLTEMDAEIIALFQEGLSEKAIGEKVGLSQKGVNKRKHRIFAQLKAVLAKLL